MSRRLEIATAAGPAIVELDRRREPVALLVLTHGAGAGVQTVDLLAVREAAGAAASGSRIAVALLTQPYRAAGRRSPPKPGPQDAAWLQAVATLRRRRGFAGLPLVVGGRSNGARVACRTARACGAGGVVALAFPLHVPGRPEKSRVDELDSTLLPTLVVQGDRDPFGMPPAASNRQLIVVHGADHGLKKGLDVLADAVISFVTSVARRDNV